MTDIMKASFVEGNGTNQAECENIVSLKDTGVEVENTTLNLMGDTRTNEENKTMFDVKETRALVFADRTYKTEVEVNRFLKTLTPEQLDRAEVMVDDDTFVVFYPRLRQPAAFKSGFHFDCDSVRPATVEADARLLGDSDGDCGAEYQGGVIPQHDFSEQERAAALAVLLASVRL
jgi:hypothetical protein